MQTNELHALGEVLRFPTDARGWSAIEDYTYLPALKPNVAKSVSASLSQGRAALRELGDVLRVDPEAHEKAAMSIPAEAWRLLYYRGIFTADSLLLPRFHSEQALRGLCSEHDPFEDPPAEWLGTERAVQEIATELELTLRYLGSRPAVAAWLVLSIAQRIDLTPAEVRHCTWWDPRWLRSLTERVLVVS